MSAPPFGVGDSGCIAGMEWKVMRGRKAPGDLVLVARVPDWTYVSMEWGGLFADFHYQIEDILYPDAKGGKKYLEHVRRATRSGFVSANYLLRLEKRSKGIPQRLFDDGLGRTAA